MTFREFMEQTALGDLSYKDFSPPGQNYPQQGSILLPSTSSGTEAENPVLPMLPSLDLGLPSVTKTGTIAYLNTKTDPILISLSDGTKLYIPYSHFKKIKGEPSVGKTITVIMQRHPGDKSEYPSNITSCVVN